MEKYCKKCKKYQTFNNFHKHKNGQFGLYPICKSCRKNNICREEIKDENLYCKFCNQTLNSCNFFKNKNSKNGFCNICKNCTLIKRSENSSKLDNYFKIIFNKFSKKNKTNFTIMELKRCYHQQNKKCFISDHIMTHIVDKKGRTDNIFNISILPIVDKEVYNIEDIKLTINLFYSVSKKYNFSTKNILDIYRELIHKDKDDIIDNDKNC